MSASNMSAEDLARCWVDMTRLGSSCPNNVFDAGFRLNNVAYDEPEKAWSAIELIIDGLDRRGLIEGGNNDLRRLASNLGAGPVETLIAQHGAELIEKIERRAAEDDRAAWVLGCVWQNSMPDDIWARVRRAAGGMRR